MKCLVYEAATHTSAGIQNVMDLIARLWGTKKAAPQHTSFPLRVSTSTGSMGWIRPSNEESQLHWIIAFSTCWQGATDRLPNILDAQPNNKRWASHIHSTSRFWVGSAKQGPSQHQFYERDITQLPSQSIRINGSELLVIPFLQVLHWFLLRQYIDRSHKDRWWKVPIHNAQILSQSHCPSFWQMMNGTRAQRQDATNLHQSLLYGRKGWSKNIKENLAPYRCSWPAVLEL